MSRYCFAILIFNDAKMREKNITDIIKRVSITFGNDIYLKNLNMSHKNWLEIEDSTVLSEILSFLKSLGTFSQKHK